MTGSGGREDTIPICNRNLNSNFGFGPDLQPQSEFQFRIWIWVSDLESLPPDPYPYRIYISVISILTEITNESELVYLTPLISYYI